MRRVSFHQSIFDLLGIAPPPVLDGAAKEVAAAEAAARRRLPATVRDWFVRDGNVIQKPGQRAQGTLWHEYTNADQPVSLAALLAELGAGDRALDDDEARPRPPGLLTVMHENQGVCTWYVKSHTDDPTVVVEFGDDWNEEAPFSRFLLEWFWGFYQESYTPLSAGYYQRGRAAAEAPPKPHLHGLWLHATTHPLAPPEHDALLENMNEGARRDLEDRTVQLEFTAPGAKGALLRVTTDPYEGGGNAVHWLSAPDEDALVAVTKIACAHVKGLSRALGATSKEGRRIFGRRL